MRTESMRRPASGVIRRAVATFIDDVVDISRPLAGIARREGRAAGIRIGLGVGLFAVAVFAIGFALLFLSLALWWAIGLTVGNAWSGLIVGLFWLVLTVALIIAGIRTLKGIRGFPQTTATLKDVAEGVRNPSGDSPREQEQM